MQSHYKDFIGFYNNIYDDYFCTHMINEFERIRTLGYCGNRQDSEGTTKTNKQDEFFFLNMRNHVFAPYNGVSVESIFFNGLQQCFDNYVNEYDVLKNVNLRCTSIKMQKSNPGSGYHVWHFEQGNDTSTGRCLTYIIYLNDLEDDAAGETELLYQKLRIKAKENTAIIFPASYTHTHRGNVVHGDKPKYIITGWFYLE